MTRPELVRRRSGMLLEEPDKIALRAEAEMVGDFSDIVLPGAQAADGGLDTKGVEIDARAHSGATFVIRSQFRVGSLHFRKRARRTLFVVRFPAREAEPSGAGASNPGRAVGRAGGCSF